jgi:hypothetical protein
MSRLKIYYTVDEIRENLHTSGSEWMLEDNTEFKGLYHKYLTGEVFTGATYIEGTSKKLIKFEKPDTTNYIYKQLKPNININFKTPNVATVNITEQDIKIGFIRRYFIKKINNDKIIEIDLKQFDNWKSGLIDKNMYSAIRVLWYISGEKQDVISSNNKNLGVVSKNIQQIRIANKTLTGIDKLLTDPLQYYTDIDFIAPVDINGLDS